jgi:hypothetical protein
MEGSDFKREYELRNALTMVSSEDLGEKDGKVFLRRKTMSLVNKKKWNEEIWFTETNNLDTAFLAELKKEVPNQASGAIGASTPQPQRCRSNSRKKIDATHANVSAYVWR